MLRNRITPLAAAALLAGQPVAAQDQGAGGEEAQIMAALAEAFPVEPLSEGQRALLPLATSIVDKMIPPGTLDELMGDMFDKLMGPIMSLSTKPTAGEFAKQLGVEAYDLREMSEEELAEALNIIDPAHEERKARIAQVMPEMMGRMMATMEPPLRKAMSEAYAITFSQQELIDIDQFFSTESGLSFARKSFAMSSDPRIIGATMEALPDMMASMGDIEAQMKAAAADVAEPRDLADLSPEERARISELTGLSPDSF